MRTGHLDESFTCHQHGCPQSVQLQMQRRGFVEKQLGSGREFQIANPEDHCHRQAWKCRYRHGRIPVVGGSPTQLLSDFDQMLGVGAEMMGDDFSGKFMWSPEKRTAMREGTWCYQLAGRFCGRSGGQVKRYQEIKMGRFISMKMMMRTYLANTPLCNVDNVGLTENQDRKNIFIIPIFGAGAFGDLVGIQGFKFFPGLFFSGEHAVLYIECGNCYKLKRLITCRY